MLLRLQHPAVLLSIFCAILLPNLSDCQTLEKIFPIKASANGTSTITLIGRNFSEKMKVAVFSANSGAEAVFETRRPFWSKIPTCRLSSELAVFDLDMRKIGGVEGNYSVGLLSLSEAGHRQMLPDRIQISVRQSTSPMFARLSEKVRWNSETYVDFKATVLEQLSRGSLAGVSSDDLHFLAPEMTEYFVGEHGKDPERICKLGGLLESTIRFIITSPRPLSVELELHESFASGRLSSSLLASRSKFILSDFGVETNAEPLISRAGRKSSVSLRNHESAETEEDVNSNGTARYVIAGALTILGFVALVAIVIGIYCYFKSKKNQKVHEVKSHVYAPRTMARVFAGDEEAAYGGVAPPAIFSIDTEWTTKQQRKPTVEIHTSAASADVPPTNPTSGRGDGAKLTANSKLKHHIRKGRLIATGERGGEVYRAVHLETGEMLGVKQISLRRVTGLTDLRNEVAILITFSHPNLVSFRGMWADLQNKIVSLCLDYVSGSSLHAIIQKYGPLTEDLLSALARPILEGLFYLHSRDTPHRDLRPQNILVDHMGLVKLSDFSISNFVDGAVNLNRFMAPEAMGAILERERQRDRVPYMKIGQVLPATKIVAKRDVKQSDVWSLGCTIYFSLTGKLIWANVTDENLITAVPAAKKIFGWNSPTISDKLFSFLGSCLKLEARERSPVSELCSHPWVLKKGEELDVTALPWLKQKSVPAAAEEPDLPQDVDKSEFKLEHEKSLSMRTDEYSDDLTATDLLSSQNRTPKRRGSLSSNFAAEHPSPRPQLKCKNRFVMDLTSDSASPMFVAAERRKLPDTSPIQTSPGDSAAENSRI